MRNIKLTCALIILLAVPSLVVAGTLENVSGVADCNSWSADLTISFRPDAMLARVEYTVVLQDAIGTEVDRFEYANFIDVPTTPTAVFSYGGDWNSALDGNYTVTGDFTVYDIFGDGYNASIGTFTSDLTCGTAGSDPVCVFPARYWARHPDLWPVTSLEISGRMRDQADLLRMLDRSRHQMLGFQLVRELVAAKLNLANGVGADIAPVVAEADDYLSARPKDHRTVRRGHRWVMRLKARLFQFNRRGCDGPPSDGVFVTPSNALAESGEATTDKAAVELMSLGSIKAMYQ